MSYLDRWWTHVHWDWWGETRQPASWLTDYWQVFTNSLVICCVPVCVCVMCIRVWVCESVWGWSFVSWRYKTTQDLRSSFFSCPRLQITITQLLKNTLDKQSGIQHLLIAKPISISVYEAFISLRRHGNTATNWYTHRYTHHTHTYTSPQMPFLLSVEPESCLNESDF